MKGCSILQHTSLYEIQCNGGIAIAGGYNIHNRQSTFIPYPSKNEWQWSIEDVSMSDSEYWFYDEVDRENKQSGIKQVRQLVKLHIEQAKKQRDT